MGKQVRFYMLPEDERMFLEFVYQNRTVVLLDERSSEPKLHILGKPPVAPQQRSDPGTILLWDTTFPINESDIQKIHLREYREEVGIYMETGQVVYYIDKSALPVIELNSSFIRPDGSLAKGRIWAEMHQFRENIFVYKGKDFESWYNQLAKWLRRNFKRIEGIDGYFGPKAFEWYQEGGKLGK
jgi:hypothetical protein